MPDTPNNPADLTPADMRRASALVVHWARRDQEGVQAVLAETSEAGRAVSLILAVISMYDEIVPAIHTELGMSLLSHHVLRLAGMDEEQQS